MGLLNRLKLSVDEVRMIYVMVDRVSSIGNLGTEIRVGLFRR